MEGVLCAMHLLYTKNTIRVFKIEALRLIHIIEII
jgi:hypothetical protein